MSDATNGTPPVMVALGADLIREAIYGLMTGGQYASGMVFDIGHLNPFEPEMKADIARMEATAKALAEALPGGEA